MNGAVIKPNMGVKGEIVPRLHFVFSVSDAGNPYPSAILKKWEVVKAQ